MTIHWVRVARGRSLGYRRPANGPGTWTARAYVGQGNGSPYRKRSLGTADDGANANGKTTLSYGQATEHLLAWDPHSEGASVVTIGDAVHQYLEYLEDFRKSASSARYALEAHVLPALGDIEVENLRVDTLRRWLRDLANSPAKGNASEADPLEQERKRKSTANRVFSSLRAALNRAWRDGKVSDAARSQWQRIKPFPSVERSRTRYLEREEMRRLLNSCEPDFRSLVLGAIHTGARYGELIALHVDDFRPESSSVRFRRTKSGGERHVYLGDEGLSFFEELTAGRPPSENMFLRYDSADGSQPRTNKGVFLPKTRTGRSTWGSSHQTRRMKNACIAAGIEPLGFHQLRHSYASLYLMSGGSLVALAKQLGHSTTRMVEKHYGHLADHWRAREASKHAPRLGLDQPNIKRLRRGVEAGNMSEVGIRIRAPHD